MSPYDRLHTLYKGIVEHCLAWISYCILLIGRIDISRRNNFSTLDELIKTFPRHHSLVVFGHFLFHSGLSGYIKTDSTRNDSAGAYLLSGSLESYKLPALLFQVMLSIGFSGNIVPNTQSWCREHNLNMNINPTSLIVKAASMVLELVLFFKVTSITESNLIKLNSFIKMAIEQVNIYA
jgi:hypothetical protein